MALGHLKDFYNFDFEGFFSGKTAEITDIQPLFDYDKDKDGNAVKTDRIIGTKIICTIIKDNTQYKTGSEKDHFVNNKYKPIVFKIKTVDYDVVKVGDLIGSGGYEPIVDTVTPYGKNGFVNDLSIFLKGLKPDKPVKDK